MTVFDKIEDNYIGISEYEAKIEQLEQEIKELSRQGSAKYIEVLEKRLEIAELEVEIIDLKGMNDRLAFGKLKQDAVERKDGKQLIEYKYLGECYAQNNSLQQNIAKREVLEKKARIMLAKQQQGTEEYKKLQEEIENNELEISRNEKDLKKAKESYARQGGLQGENIDFNVPFDDILNETCSPVYYKYDIHQLYEDVSKKIYEEGESKIQDELKNIFTKNLDGGSKELAEIYAEVFPYSSNNHFGDELDKFDDFDVELYSNIPDEIIKTDKGKYVVVYKGDSEERIGVKCIRNEETGKLEVIGGKGKIVQEEEIAKLHEGSIHETITREQMEMQVVRNNIEKSMPNCKVTEILEITDNEMLEYFNKQNNLQQYHVNDSNHQPKVYMISRQDNRGEIHYEFVSHNSANGYKIIDGMQPVQVEQQNIMINEERMQGVPTPMQKVEKQFVDKDGKKYFMYHEFVNGPMALAKDEKQSQDKAKVQSDDYGINTIWHNFRVNELFRKGRNALGLGYNKVKEIYNKYRGQENTRQQENQKEIDD